MTHPDYRTVAAEFGDSAQVAPGTLIDAFARYAGRCIDNGRDLVITDALIPHIPSLLAWGHSESEIASVITELEKVSGDLTVIIIMLTSDPAVTLPRAIAREADGWADSYIQKLTAAPGTAHVVDLPTAIQHLRDEAAVSRRLISRSGWQLITVDATADPSRVAELVLERLGERSAPSA
ncbi:hypothetical protein [Microlunatus soli]|nr:hypothetical protein [Microlunatus soli]